MSEKIPKKITPDGIKESIIEVKYTSKLPFEVIIGLLFNALDDTYFYTNNNPKSSRLGEIAYLFYNDHILIKITPGSIIFDCASKYVSWDIFIREIRKALDQMSSVDFFEEFTRVGVRYISEYNHELEKCIDFKIESSVLENVKCESYSFNTEFHIDEFIVILNIKNNLPRLKKNSENLEFANSHSQSSLVRVSVVDIDVILENLHEKNISVVCEHLESAHNKEKQIFFKFLKPDYLATLNPEY